MMIFPEIVFELHVFWSIQHGPKALNIRTHTQLGNSFSQMWIFKSKNRQEQRHKHASTEQNHQKWLFLNVKKMLVYIFPWRWLKTMQVHSPYERLIFLPRHSRSSTKSVGFLFCGQNSQKKNRKIHSDRSTLDFVPNDILNLESCCRWVLI